MRRALFLTLICISFGTVLLPKVKRRLRRVCRGILLFFLRLRSRPLALGAGSLLVVAPHQDDGTLGCGGLLFQRRLAGHPVDVVYLTDGSASHPGHPTLSPADVAALRRREAHQAKYRLGVDSARLRFLDLPDGRLASLTPPEREAALARLADLFAELVPEAVLLPLHSDGSSEHVAGFQLVREGLARAGLRPRLFEYPVWAVWSPLLLLRPLFTACRIHRFDFAGYGPTKALALSAYVSQFQPTPPWSKAVLPEDFGRAFSPEREFFFEYPP